MTSTASHRLGGRMVTSSDDKPANEEQDAEHVSDVEQLARAGTEPLRHESSLSKDHQIYLIARHGTLELDPVPGMGSADPYNWPKWKKVTNLVLVGLHAMMGTLTAGVIVPAYSSIAEDLSVTLQQASYLTSLQIAILGVAPLVWKPLSNRWGRRPIFLLSMICSLVTNVGCAKCPSYATMALCRAINAFFVSPAGALGSAVVTETFFKHERARYMGVWTLLVTCGIPVGPLAFGFVTTHIGYRWIFWILAMVNAVQFITYLFFGPETRYLHKGVQIDQSDVRQEYFNIFVRRIDPSSIKAVEFIRPLFLSARLYILIPACAYAMNFLWGTILSTVEIPQLFEEKFGLNAEQIGLQFIAGIIGGVIGEQFGGTLSDLWMKRHTTSRHRAVEKPRSERETERNREPEFRLWLSYMGFISTIVGVIVFLLQTQLAKAGTWNVKPLIGVGIAATGNQIVTTILITYAVDCVDREEGGDVGVMMTFVRQIWAFIGPFWFPALFSRVGVAASAGVATALILGISVVPVVLLHWQGKKWRSR